MPTDVSLPTEEIQKLYATGQYSMDKIAAHYGVSRQAIHWHIHGKRNTTATKRPIEVTCDGCGKKFILERKRGRPSPFHYCGDPCTKPTRKEELWKLLVEEILE